MKNERLKKLCIYMGDDWVDIIRIHPIPCDGMIRYVVHHVEEEDLHIFDSVSEALEFIVTEYVACDSCKLRIGECP
jgi:hypothetical protein